MDTQAGQESLYHAALQQAGDAVVLLDALTLAIVAANSAAERMIGYSQADLRQISPAVLILVAPRGKGTTPFADIIATGVSEFEGWICTRSGDSISASIGVSKIAHGRAHYVLLIMRDISEQRRRIQQLAQTEKLAAMERLTASIAHEMNNPLQALHNSLHLLLSRQFSEGKREQLLNMAHSEVERLILLVQRMLESRRPSSEGMHPISIHGLLERVLMAMAHQIRQHGVVVERDWAARLPRVIGSEGHLKQVILNLAINAIEAMPGGGRLVIRTRVAGGAHPGDPSLVLVEFADSGPGIPEDKTQLIFEPFYTTKNTNMGLGLAISYSIVEQHGGVLSVSNTGAGTTFRVELPVAGADSRH